LSTTGGRGLVHQIESFLRRVTHRKTLIGEHHDQEKRQEERQEKRQKEGQEISPSSYGISRRRSPEISSKTLDRQ
jgi:dihydroxyacetone kinase-like predicted kinase